MDRRKFLFTSSGVAGFSALAAAGCSGTPAGPAAGQDRPNVLVIYTDEHSYWTLGAFGSNLVGTPHLDSIGREGAIFHNFFTNSAVCTPSRGCFLTGRYPHSHGAYVNNIELNRDEITFAEVLRQNGYETGYAGKWHLDGEPRPGWLAAGRAMGFEDCQWMFNRGHWKRVVERPMGWPRNRSVAKVGKQPVVPEEPDGRPDLSYDVGDEGEYFTDWLTDKAIEFIERPRDNPFCYMLSIPDPHTPLTVREPYASMYKPEDMPVPSTLYLENLPDWAAQARQQTARQEGFASWRDPARAESLKKRKAQYCGEVKCIDDNVGRILAALREKGILDDTLIVFCCDHGQYMGEHGLMMKNQLYETAYRLPFMLRWPKKIPAGTVVDNVVATVDFQKTLLSLVGLEPCGREQGRDASRLLRGESAGWREEAWIHHSSLERAGIFTREWELALVHGADGILFDRMNDPEQVNNLFNDPAHKAVRDELVERVVAHQRETGSPAARWLDGMPG